jgi:glutaredoxin 3
MDYGVVLMAKIEIYTGNLCGFCTAAKRLLTQKGAKYAETNVHDNTDKRAEMVQRSNGGRTVPQIFINDIHVGGCDDLFDLERLGKLDQMLAA